MGFKWHRLTVLSVVGLLTADFLSSLAVSGLFFWLCFLLSALFFFSACISVVFFVDELFLSLYEDW